MGTLLILVMLGATPDTGTPPPLVAAPAAAVDDAGRPCPAVACRYANFGNCGPDNFRTDPCAAAKAAAEQKAAELAREGLKGFQKAEWGMTLAQVTKLFPGGHVSGDKAKGTLVLKKDVAGLDAELAFIFDGAKRLVEVRVAFEDQQKGFADWRQICTAVTNALTERYGGGDTSDEVLESYSVRWRGRSTLLQLDCSGVAIWPKKSVVLFYSDRAFQEAQPNVKSDDL
jgi:hypothetical protein